MKVFAYSYSKSLSESVLNLSVWKLEVEQVYQDWGDRHLLDPLLNQLRQARDLDSEIYLLVRRLDELGDSMQEVGDRLTEFESLGVIVLVVEEPVNSIANPIDAPERQLELLQLVRSLQQSQQRDQSQQSQRIRAGHAHNRIKALPPPGKAPYGYRRGKDRYVLDRATAPVVKDFFEHFLLYGSLRGSVRYLQKKYNKKISASTGKRWLTSPVYRGNLVYQTGEVMPDTHVAILSRQEAAQVDRLLRRNRQMAPKTASAPRSLAGLVVCGACQSPMTVSRVAATRNSQEYLYLRAVGSSSSGGISACPQQPKCRAIPYNQVLEQTIQRICEDLPGAVDNLQLPNMEGIKQGLAAQIETKQAVLEQLPDLISTGVLDVETAELRVYKVRSEIAQLQAQLSQLPPVDLKATAQAVSIPQFWLDLSETERRFYFREFIRQIQIVREGKAWTLKLVFIF